MAALGLVPVAWCVHGAWLLDGPVQHEVRICVENHWSGLGCFWDPSGLGTGKPDVMKIKWISTVGFGVLVAEDYGLGANAAQTYQNPNVKAINTQFQNSNGSRIFKDQQNNPVLQVTHCNSDFVRRPIPNRWQHLLTLEMLPPMFHFRFHRSNLQVMTCSPGLAWVSQPFHRGAEAACFSAATSPYYFWDASGLNIFEQCLQRRQG